MMKSMLGLLKLVQYLAGYVEVFGTEQESDLKREKRGEERANLSAFRTFVRFVLFGFVGFLFLLGSGKGCVL